MTTRRRIPDRRQHEVIEFQHGGVRFIAGIGRFTDGKLAEIFLDCGRQGCGAEASARESAILVSIALQHGLSAASLRHALQELADGSGAGPLAHALDLIGGAP